MVRALVRAAALLGSSEKAKRLEAAGLLAASRAPATHALLLERLRQETDADVKAALQQSLRQLMPGQRLRVYVTRVETGELLLMQDEAATDGVVGEEVGSEEAAEEPES